MAATATDADLERVRAGVGSDVDSLLVYSLLRTHQYLGPFVDAALRRQELTAAQFNALLVLRAAGSQGLLMGEIGRRLVVTKSNVTGLVDRLQRHGLVERCDHRDRRATVVRLTRAGTRRVDRATPRQARLLAELTGCLAAREKQALIRLLSKLRRGLRIRRKERD